MSVRIDEVFVLIIDNDFGVSTYVCETEEVAYRKLDDYVKEWWEREDLWNGTKTPMPEDREERINTYFCELAQSEFYYINISRIYRE